MNLASITVKYDSSAPCVPAVPIPPGIRGAFSPIVRPGGRTLVYPGAFDGLMIFMLQRR